ncbi:MAG TPA: hypothetical protein VE152_07915, partial [Acidimicrobiales bacterium]|nr:hypothetical protein [Acidimicrobiales bacterium]
AATAAAAAGEGLRAVLDEARVAGGDALARTRDQLPALTRAQVVDAGGAGYTLLVDALLTVVDGRRLPDPGAVPWAPPVATEAEEPAAASGGPAADGPPDPPVESSEATGPRFEVMCRLSASEEAIPTLREAWVARGESVVIAGEGTAAEDGVAWSCHVHTDDIGAVLQAALDAGRPRDVRVVDLAGGGHRAPVGPGPGAEGQEAPGEALTLVVTGEVTQAVRASEGVAGPVAVGDWLGLSAGRIEVVEAAGPAEAACGLLAKLCRDDHRRVVLVEGAGVAAADTRRVREWLDAHRPWAAVEVHQGGQRRHPYLVSIE